MEKHKMTINFPVEVNLVGQDDSWTATIVRKIDETKFPVAIIKNLTAAECYTRLGAKVPKEEVTEEEGKAAAMKVLQEGIASIQGRTQVTTSEISDLFIDAMNALGFENE